MGALVAARYQLKAPLGRGSQGEVWEAEDRLTGSAVAVKIMSAGALEPARVRREVSALRLLDLPGVVRLLDEGQHDGRTFVVMDLVRGEPFPGHLRRAQRQRDGRLTSTWEDLAAPTVALLETLTRVHAAGIVHRDLKPSNILVTERGLPKVLDFGLATGIAIGEDLTQNWTIIGTPAYLSPEQITGRPATAQSDLYSVGLLLYECLTGRVPHVPSREPGSFRDLAHLARERLRRAPIPIAEIAPDTTPAVATLVSRMLSVDPAGRPPSAQEVLRLLDGQKSGAIEEKIPYLGDRGSVNAIVEELNRGRSVEVFGGIGSGKKRTSDLALQALQASGRVVIRTLPSRLPLASLEPVMADCSRAIPVTLEEALAGARDRVISCLAGGGVIVCEDDRRCDPWSRRVLEECAQRGAILTVRSTSERWSCAKGIRVEPLQAEDLKKLFSVSDRLTHLRKDAARELFERTNGIPSQIRDELHAWVRAGIARHDGEGFVIDRLEIDRLELGQMPLRPMVSPLETENEALPAHVAEMLAWAFLAQQQATAPTLAAAMGRPLWLVQAALEELAWRGLAEQSSSGRFYVHGWAPVEQWPIADRAVVHRALAEALPEGAGGRFFHLLRSGVGKETSLVRIASEAMVTASAWAEKGRLGPAAALLDESHRAVRRGAHGAVPDVELEDALLSLWLEIALADWTPQAVDRVLYELSRTHQERDLPVAMRALAQAALALGTDGRRALSLLRAMPPLPHRGLERRRRHLTMVAARSSTLLEEEEVLAEMRAWAASTDDPLAPVRVSAAEARLRYREGRFDEAADLFLVAAGADGWETDRIAARINAASSLLEAFRHREARWVGRDAILRASSCRHPFLEARAEWVVRAATHRLGEITKPDLDLVLAVQGMHVFDLEALVCLTEAAIAYRAGSLDIARTLGDQAIARWTSAGIQAESVLLVRCLNVACGELLDEAEFASLVTRARQCAMMGIGIQSLGLLARARPERRLELAVGSKLLVAGIPREHWSDLLDILSVRESLDALDLLEPAP